MDRQTVLVVGLARSGIAAALLLADSGMHVRLSDRKTEKELGAALEPLGKVSGIEYRLGEDPLTLLDGVTQIVLSPGVPDTHPVVVRAREMGIEVIGELELAYRHNKGRLIGITGTNGKTTTTTLVGELCKNAGKRTYVVGNIGFPFSAIVGETRPEDVVVCEVSSYQLETIDAFHPSVSAILNITEDHLSRHKTMENYIRHKAKIAQNQTPNDTLVLNYDDPLTRALADQVPCRVQWFSRRETPPDGAFVRDGWIMLGAADQARQICRIDEVGIPGPHNLENALAATVIAGALNVPPPVIRHTLRTFKGVEHRIEFVRELDRVRYINDSKGTNVDSTIKAIETMRDPTVIILGGSTKRADMRPLAEAIRGSMITDAVLVGDTADEIASALDKAGFTRYVRAGYDFERAIGMARKLAQPGGNVLLSPACASFDMFVDYEDRGAKFKAIVRALEPD